MFQDLRFGLRMMLKSRGFTMVAVLSLSLGIGANTAIFSLIDAILLKKLPVRKPEELVLFNWFSGPKRMSRNVYGDIGPDVASGLTTSTASKPMTSFGRRGPAWAMVAGPVASGAGAADGLR